MWIEQHHENTYLTPAKNRTRTTKKMGLAGCIRTETEQLKQDEWVQREQKIRGCRHFCSVATHAQSTFPQVNAKGTAIKTVNKVLVRQKHPVYICNK